MKISPKKYASALFWSLQGKSQPEAKKIIDRFVHLLAEHNRLGSIHKVIFYLESLYEKEGLLFPASLISARKLDEGIKSQLLAYLKEKSGKANLDWREESDKSLIGGLILRYRDKIFDASLKTRLKDFSRHLEEK